MTKWLMVVRLLMGMVIVGYVLVRCINLIMGFFGQSFSFPSLRKSDSRFWKRLRYRIRKRKPFFMMYQKLLDTISSSAVVHPDDTSFSDIDDQKKKTSNKVSIEGPDTIQQQQIKKILYEATQAQDKGNFTDYEQKLIEGLAIFPYHPECNRRLAGYYIKTNNTKKATPLLKKVLEYDPQDHEAIWQLGDIYLQEGNFSKAQQFIHKAICLSNDRPKYYVSMVEIMYNTNRLDEAISYMQKAVTLRPANVSYLIALGELYEEHNDIENAKKYYFQVLEYEPSHTEAKKKLNRL